MSCQTKWETELSKISNIFAVTSGPVRVEVLQTVSVRSLQTRAGGAVGGGGGGAP